MGAQAAPLAPCGTQGSKQPAAGALGCNSRWRGTATGSWFGEVYISKCVTRVAEGGVPTAFSQVLSGHRSHAQLALAILTGKRVNRRGRDICDAPRRSVITQICANRRLGVSCFAQAGVCSKLEEGKRRWLHLDCRRCSREKRGACVLRGLSVQRGGGAHSSGEAQP